MTHSAKILLLSFLCTIAAGCATTPRVALEKPLRPAIAEPGPNAIESANTSDKSAGLRQASTPSLPEQGSNVAGTSVKISEPNLSGPPITASLADMPLPAFINEVFGNLLQINFQMDPSLGSKSDLVTLRLPSAQAPQDLYRLAVQLLREYGVGVSWDGALLTIAPSAQVQGKEPPLVISGRTLPDVPISHRPIFQLVELQAVRNRDVAGWLKMAYESPDLKIEEDINRNAIVLFGKPELVTQAVAAIKVLDRPFMRGRYSTRLEPAFVSATELSQRLIEVLGAEGYAVSNQVSQSSNTIILPVNSANIVLVFTADQALLSHVIDWGRSIDKPNENASGNSLFYYQVRNTKAEGLVNVLRGLTLSNAANAPTAAPVAGAAPNGAAPPPTNTAGASTGGRLTVDGPRNAIIFQGEASEWQRMLSLIRQMDKAIRQVMIEVTIAEVTLKDNEKFGVSWLAKDNHGRFGGSWASGVVAPVSAAGGLTYLLDVNGNNRAQLQAFADDNRVTVLSTPRLLVKSGEEASIDVGDEVPIITTQTTSSQQTGGTNNLLQAIQYRKTGILLNVKPTVYSDNRIDLEISQEVSQALDVLASSAVQSPTISNRSVKTSLSLRDGGSVMLAGLMSEELTRATDGVPHLKNIPVLGNLFKSQKKTKSKQELVLIIVPYIIESDSQAQAITQAMNDRLEYIDLPAPLALPAPTPAPPQAPSQAPLPAQTMPLPEEVAPASAESVPPPPVENASLTPAEPPVPPAAENKAPSADAPSSGTLP